MISLQRKIIVKYIIFLMIIAILPLLSIGFISYQTSSHTLQQAEARFAHALLNSQKELLNLQLDQVENLIANIAGVEEITRALEEHGDKADTYTSLATQARIGYILNGYLHLQGLVSIDIFTEGGTHYHVGDTLNVSEINEETKEVLRSEAMQSNRQIYWAGVVPNVNRASNHQHVLTAARILSTTDRKTLNRRPIALLLVNYSLEHLREHFSHVDLGPDTSITLLDHRKNVIYSKEPRDQDYLPEDILSHIVQSEQPPAIVNWHNERYFIQYQLLPNLGWQLISIIPEHAMLYGVHTIRDVTALLLLAGFLIIGFAAWFISRNVVKPVRDVISGYEQLQNNVFDLEQRLPVRSNDEIGELVKWFNSFLDNLTARRTAEAHLQTLLETLPDVVWMQDKDGIYLVCNPRFEHLVGSPQSEIVGRAVPEIIGHALPKFLSTYTLGRMGAGNSITQEEKVTFADDGHEELLEIVKTPIFSHDCTLIGILGVGRNITERRQAEEGLRRAQKMDAIGQLTGGIAHDFNNILAIIIGNLELLKRPLADDPKSLKRIESIQKASERAANLTKQLLGFSRRQAIQVTITDINEVIKGMEELIVRSLTPEVMVVHNFTDHLWRTEINPGDFQDSLINLCINARDAMAGHGHLTIETCNTTLDDNYCSQNPGSKPGQYVQLVVSDQGKGIPADQQEHIFEPFYTTKEKSKGSGLGLAIVYGFVQRSGGHIKVYSKEDIGTTFRLYLPRAEADIITIDLNSEQSKTLPRGDETILVVDDEAPLLELAREFLDSLGYRVFTANDGQEALDTLQNEPTIDLLFSDVVMPGDINGYELAEKATTNRPEIKVLLASGYTGKSLIRDGLSHINTNLLSKPYTQAELATQVRDILDATSPHG
jgi:PAS domain S-box-containing protein